MVDRYMMIVGGGYTYLVRESARTCCGLKVIDWIASKTVASAPREIKVYIGSEEDHDVLQYLKYECLLDETDDECITGEFTVIGVWYIRHM